MKSDEVRAAVLRALASVAPEIDIKTVNSRTPLRDQYDLDSVDFLNFVVALHAETDVDVPEADYAKIASIDDCVGYVERTLALRSSQPREV